MVRPSLFQPSLSDNLSNMNHFAAGIEGAVYTNFLAFELLYLILGVDVVSVAASGILKYILIARLRDRAREDLDVRRLRLSLGIRCRLC